MRLPDKKLDWLDSKEFHELMYQLHISEYDDGDGTVISTLNRIKYFIRQQIFEELLYVYSDKKNVVFKLREQQILGYIRDIQNKGTFE